MSSNKNNVNDLPDFSDIKSKAKSAIQRHVSTANKSNFKKLKKKYLGGK